MADVPVRRKSSWYERKLQRVGLLFIMPVVLYTVIFRFAPMVASLYLSFTRYNALQPAQWVGWRNYARIFESDLFWTALKNTALYSLEVLPLNVAISFGLALLVNRKIRGIALFRTIFYLPVVTSIVAVSMIWMWLYDYDLGLINLLLEYAGLGPYDWLGDPNLALHSLVVMRVWKGVGWNMVIYLAALQEIPAELYEAAAIDGASSWKRMLKITWPLLRPVTFYITVMGIISTFQTFGEIYTMTKGGPLDSTTTVGYLIYRQAFDQFQMGQASATSFVLLGVILALTLVNNKVMSSRVEG